MHLLLPLDGFIIWPVQDILLPTRRNSRNEDSWDALPTRTVHNIIPQSPSHGICPSLPVPANANAVGILVSASTTTNEVLESICGSSFSQLCLALLVHPHTLTLEDFFCVFLFRLLPLVAQADAMMIDASSFMWYYEIRLLLTVLFSQNRWEFYR